MAVSRSRSAGSASTTIALALRDLRLVLRHFALGDPHEMRAVVAAQPVRVAFVHEVAAFAGRDAVADHRLVADRHADENVEVLAVSSLRCRCQQPAVQDRCGAQRDERFVRFGGRVGVAVGFVGDQHMPVDQREVAAVAFHDAVGHEQHAGAAGAASVKRADLRGERSALVRDRHVSVHQQRRHPAVRRADGQRVVPLLDEPAVGDDQAAHRRRRGGALIQRAAGGCHRLAGPDVGGVQAGADSHLRGDRLLWWEKHRVGLQGPRCGHPQDPFGARVDLRVHAAALHHAHPVDGLLGDEALGDGSNAVGARDRDHAGAAAHAADQDRVAEGAGGFA
jgi:hypothetical protein